MIVRVNTVEVFIYHINVTFILNVILEYWICFCQFSLILSFNSKIIIKISIICFNKKKKQIQLQLVEKISIFLFRFFFCLKSISVSVWTIENEMKRIRTRTRTRRKFNLFLHFFLYSFSQIQFFSCFFKGIWDVTGWMKLIFLHFNLHNSYPHLLNTFSLTIPIQLP